MEEQRQLQALVPESTEEAGGGSTACRCAVTARARCGSSERGESVLPLPGKSRLWLVSHLTASGAEDLLQCREPPAPVPALPGSIVCSLGCGLGPLFATGWEFGVPPFKRHLSFDQGIKTTGQERARLAARSGSESLGLCPRILLRDVVSYWRSQ